MGKLTFWMMGLPVFLFGIGNNVTVHFSIHDEGGNAVTNAEIKARTRRRAMNASGMGLTCELWLGPATWTYANAALEASRIDMHARGFSTEGAIESRE